MRGRAVERGPDRDYALQPLANFVFSPKESAQERDGDQPAHAVAYQRRVAQRRLAPELMDALSQSAEERLKVTGGLSDFSAPIVPETNVVPVLFLTEKPLRTVVRVDHKVKRSICNDDLLVGIVSKTVNFKFPCVSIKQDPQIYPDRVVMLEWRTVFALIPATGTFKL